VIIAILLGRAARCKPAVNAMLAHPVACLLSTGIRRDTVSEGKCVWRMTTRKIVMATVALFPRVRTMGICDGLRRNRIEPGVFDLKNVRQRITVETFPFVPHRLWLYSLLWNERVGQFPGHILVANERTDKTIFIAKLTPTPTFHQVSEFLVVPLRIRCSFPEAGRYVFQVWFYNHYGSDVLKGEMPFDVVQESW